MVGEGTGLGLVVRDETGKFLLAAVRRERNQWQPELAELRGLEFGLQMVEMHCFSLAIVESDCQTTIQKLKGEEDSRLEVGLVARELKHRANEMGQVCWSFTKRSDNEPDHVMAHSNCNWDTSETWALRPPVFLLSPLEKDGLIFE
ncbi:unnamed protein product [Linum trigynum]|uniref:RNase H type-1 domain-containing protein n=1 Tax=Linum trigynum TaxID=586398 RepID=A0AAV2DU34_9ROSI